MPKKRRKKRTRRKIRTQAVAAVAPAPSDDAPSRFGQWRVTLACAVTIVAITCAAYSGSFDGGFVSDDLQTIQDNPVLRSLGWSNLRTIFTTFDGANYMPLKVLSLAVDYRVWGPGPRGPHITNLLLHIGSALLIFSILRRMGLSAVAACIVGTVWAVHPLQVESVAWISERKNTLSALLFFAAFRVYLEYSERERIRDYVAVVILFALAMLSKMTAVVLPGVCLAYELTFRRRFRARDMWASLPLFGVGAGVVAYNMAGNPIHGGTYHGGSAIVTWLSSTVVVFRYLGKLLVPVNLSPWYDVPLRGSVLDPAVLLSVLGLAGIGAVTVWLIRTRRPAAFWVLWFGITLAPLLNIVPFRVLMQDRYMYVAMLGPLALLAMVLDGLQSTVWRQVAAGGAAIAIIAFALSTHRQVEMWSDDVTFWTTGASRVAVLGPDPVYRGRDYDAKLQRFEEMVAADPSDFRVHNALGTMHLQVGDYPNALEHLERANELAQDHPIVLMNLGRVYAYLGRGEQARELFERAARLRPYYAMARLFLARAHLFMGDAAAARLELERLEEIRPGSTRSRRREWAALEALEAQR